MHTFSEISKIFDHINFIVLTTDNNMFPHSMSRSNASILEHKKYIILIDKVEEMVAFGKR